MQCLKVVHRNVPRQIEIEADATWFLQVGTVVEWVENADKWIAGFLGKFEEGVYNVVSDAWCTKLQDRSRMQTSERIRVSEKEGKKIKLRVLSHLRARWAAAENESSHGGVRPAVVGPSTLRFPHLVLVSRKSLRVSYLIEVEVLEYKAAKLSSLIPYAGEDHHVPFAASEADSSVVQERVGQVVPQG